MSSFVNINHPAEHPGVVRFESAVDAARQMRKDFDGTRGLAALMLAAMVAAMVVVADQLVENWADGHLLAAWVAMWAVAFAGMALFAGTARRLAARVLTALDAWSSSIARARSDVRLWEAAKADPRVMADLQAAMARRDVTQEVAGLPAVVGATAVQTRGDKSIDLSSRVLRTHPSYYI